MAKLTGALLSLGGRGKIGDTLVFATWRGVQYVRQWVIPENPNTTAQQAVRTVFAWCTEAWKLAPDGLKAPWDAHASGRKYTGRNHFIGQNTKNMQGETDLALFVGSPGARGGLPPDSISAAAGSLSITVTVTQGTVPADWVLVAAQGVVVPDESPQTSFDGPFQFQEDTVTPFDTLSFTGLTASQLYRVAVWNKWTKPDGRTAYSVSLSDSATPTA